MDSKYNFTAKSPLKATVANGNSLALMNGFPAKRKLQSPSPQHNGPNKIIKFNINNKNNSNANNNNGNNNNNSNGGVAAAKS